MCHFTHSESFIKWSKNHLFICQVFLSPYFVQDTMLDTIMTKMNMKGICLQGTCYLASMPDMEASHHWVQYEEGHNEDNMVYQNNYSHTSYFLPT